ncbi:site-specific integrase [Demequina sp. B12]|uniref:tyrosine-type recombinase/integrase n=1 Tax=Demequina sp. B12 TaxID=2992757 RepID=UPI00237B9936|nr:site-specific integrase [Demequina sp. B12]MDE0571810.1 site-specific integrase [Demequina sp. B12]
MFNRPTRTGSLSFWDYFTAYADRQVWAPHTARAVHLAARTFPHKQAPLRSITPANIETWIKTMHDDGLAGSTIRTRVANVRPVFAAAVRDGHVTDNPCSGVRLPRITRRATRVALPSEEVVQRLVRGAPQPYDLLFALAAYAGLRLGEARALTWGDVDINARQVHVRHQLQQKPGGGWETLPPKYGSYRTIPLAPELIGPLLEAEREEARLVVEGPAGGPVHPGSIQRVWSRHRRSGGLPEAFHIHDLRHWFASRLIAKGTDVLTVQRQLGHAKASTSLDVYGHLWTTPFTTTRQ